MKDKDGNEWEAFADGAGRRRLRCTAGPRAGDVEDDPRVEILVPSDDEIARKRQQAEALSERDPWVAGLFRSEFPGLYDD